MNVRSRTRNSSGPWGKKANRILATGLMLSLLSGCASITGSKMQSVSVVTIQDNNTEIAGAGCTLANDIGKWFVTTPGSAVVQKSTADLAVECNKDDAGSGYETAVSRANGGVWGNILAGGLIGYAVDRNTGAGFDYPSSVTVVLRKIGKAAGIATPMQTAAAKD